MRRTILTGLEMVHSTPFCRNFVMCTNFFLFPSPWPLFRLNEILSEQNVVIFSNKWFEMNIHISAKKCCNNLAAAARRVKYNLSDVLHFPRDKKVAKQQLRESLSSFYFPVQKRSHLEYFWCKRRFQILQITCY